MVEQALAEGGVLARLQGTFPLAKSSATTAAEADLESVVREHARFVFKIGYSVLRTVEDAEDTVQETFLRVHRSGELPKVRDVKAWLARIAWRVALDHLPRKTPETPLELLKQSGFEARAAGSGAEQQLIERERGVLLHRMIGTLPPELRYPLLLSTVEELNSKEIGGVLGIPEASVRTRLFRARQILKEKLAVLMESGHGS